MFVQTVNWLAVIFILSLPACAVKPYQSSSQPVSHEIWNTLLKKYVTEDGLVNYAGFVQDSVQLNAYLDLLRGHHPNDKNWSREEQIAYWLNVYNAFTVKLIVDHYPTPSIKDIKNGIPFVNTVWDIKFIEIEGAIYDLNNIEHGILRPQFNEPRIHFAANCASISCPRLRAEAYTAEMLDAQLTDQAHYFLSNPVKNQITKEKAQLSKIFSWYKGDFKKQGSLRDFINQYSDIKIDENTEIDHLDYDWRLNGE